MVSSDFLRGLNLVKPGMIDSSEWLEAADNCPQLQHCDASACVTKKYARRAE